MSQVRWTIAVLESGGTLSRASVSSRGGLTAHKGQCAPKFLLCITVLMSVGCEQEEPPSQEIRDARIIMGESIENVEVGYTTEEVQNELGPPDAILLGDYAGFIYMYGEGSRTSQGGELSILFVEPNDDRVTTVTVKEPYDGTTGNGIGIGTGKSDVRRLLGGPDAEEVKLEWGSLGTLAYQGHSYLTGDSLAFIFQYGQNEQIEKIIMVLLRF